MAQVKGLDVFAGYTGHVSKATNVLAQATKSAADEVKARLEETKDNALVKQYNTVIAAFANFDQKLLKEQFVGTMVSMSKVGYKFATTQKEWNKYQSDMEEAQKATTATIGVIDSMKIQPMDVPPEGQTDYDLDKVKQVFMALAKLTEAREAYNRSILNEYKNNVSAQIAGDWSKTLEEALRKIEVANNKLFDQVAVMRDVTNITAYNAEQFKNMIAGIGGSMDLGGSFGQEEVEEARKGVSTIETGLA